MQLCSISLVADTAQGSGLEPRLLSVCLHQSHLVTKLRYTSTILLFVASMASSLAIDNGCPFAWHASIPMCRIGRSILITYTIVLPDACFSSPQRKAYIANEGFMCMRKLVTIPCLVYQKPCKLPDQACHLDKRVLHVCRGFPVSGFRAAVSTGPPDCSSLQLPAGVFAGFVTQGFYVRVAHAFQCLCSCADQDTRWIARHPCSGAMASRLRAGIPVV